MLDAGCNLLNELMSYNRHGVTGLQDTVVVQPQVPFGPACSDPAISSSMAQTHVTALLAVAFSAASLLALPKASAITPLGSWQVRHKHIGIYALRLQVERIPDCCLLC